ncbi:MAG: type IV toxin-antitoxin system AbiEi family antitoxin [Myxococcaceae bacterium]
MNAVGSHRMSDPHAMTAVMTIQDPDPAWMRGLFRAKEVPNGHRGRISVKQFARGLYSNSSRGEVPNTLAVLYRCPSAIASLDTALWLHGVLEREPDPIWISIPRNIRKPYLPPLRIEALRFSRVPTAEDITATYQLVDLKRFPVFELAKTAVDFIRVRERVGLAHVEAMLDLIVPKHVTPDQLRACAARHRASYPVERYLWRMRDHLAAKMQIDRA